MRPSPAFSALALVVLLGAGDCNPPTGPHVPIQGAVVAGYRQTVITGETTADIAKKSVTTTPVYQTAGTFCLFTGGSYSYQADFAYFNTAMMKGNADYDGLKYGTYTGDPNVGPVLSGRLVGPTQIVADTLTMGNNTYQRANAVATACEQLR